MIHGLVILGVIALPIALMKRSKYCENVAFCWDLLLSVYTGGAFGTTLSGRAGKSHADGKRYGRLVAPLINAAKRDPEHCAKAWRDDDARTKPRRKRRA